MSSGELGNILTVEVTDLSRGGAGVARDSTGRVIFVHFTAPGDQVKVRITRVDKRYLQAELVEVLRPSPNRVEPRCRVFGRCGGCQWQHLPYELQWKTKSGGVLHALSRVQIDPPGELEELPAEQIWEYRNRVQLRGDRREIGFYAPGTHDIVSIERCEIARTEINTRIPQAQAEGAKLPRPYKIEIDVLPSGEVRDFWNDRHAAGGFRQVHDAQNEKLQSWVAGALTGGRVVYDLYGGSGNLSLGLAPRMDRIFCVDFTAPEGAIELWGRQVPSNLEFHRAPALEWLKRKSGSSGTTAVQASAIIDPPREGLGADFHEIAVSLERLSVTELVAVGCDPDSWARDVSRFVKRGWRLERVAALDLFPQTPHIESLAILKR